MSNYSVLFGSPALRVISNQAKSSNNRLDDNNVKPVVLFEKPDIRSNKRPKEVHSMPYVSAPTAVTAYAPLLIVPRPSIQQQVPVDLELCVAELERKILQQAEKIITLEGDALYMNSKHGVLAQSTIF